MLEDEQKVLIVTISKKCKNLDNDYTEENQKLNIVQSGGIEIIYSYPQ